MTGGRGEMTEGGRNDGRGGKINRMGVEGQKRTKLGGCES